MASLTLPTGVDPRVPRGAGRSRGVVVLLAAVALVLGTSALLNPGVTGIALPVVLPAPPPVGSCLRLGADAADVVPCDGPHHAEVIRVWPAGTLPTGIVDFKAVAAYPFGGDGEMNTTGCVTAQQAWAETPGLPGTDLWTPIPPVVDGQLLAAPPSQRAADAGWIACVLVAPDRALVSGALRVGAGSPPPSRLVRCVQPATAAWGPVTLTCDQPHGIEILASFRIEAAFDGDNRFTGMPDATALTAACRELAGALTGNPDPTYGGRLVVRAVALFPSSIREVDALDPAGAPVHTYLPTPQCTVDVGGDRQLTGTVVGLGDAPLPVG